MVLFLFALHQNYLAGVFRIPSGGDSRIGVAIGDHVLDLHTLAVKGFFDEAHNLQGGTCFLKVISQHIHFNHIPCSLF